MTQVTRVTPDMIEGFISSEHFFSALDGVDGHYRGGPEAQYCKDAESLKLLTFCVLVLKNGFSVVGKSACADPANFNEEIGRKIARANAVNEIWPLMGYALRNKLAGMDGLLEPAAPWQERVRDEAKELAGKLVKLEAFLKTETFKALPNDARIDYWDQRDAMAKYLEALQLRIQKFEKEKVE